MLACVLLLADAMGDRATAEPVDAAHFYAPEWAAKYPPDYVSPCPACEDQARQLNGAWERLKQFDADHPDARKWHAAHQETLKAQAAADAAKAEAGAAPRGAARNAARAKQKTADDALTDAKVKESNSGSKEDRDKLDFLVRGIDDYAQRLAACEAACVPPAPAPVGAAGPPAAPPPPPVPQPAPTSNAGIGTYTRGFKGPDKAQDSRKGMSAKDLYTLLDGALGTNFHSLLLVYPGCFTADFTNQGERSGVGTSGKPVAILSATDRCVAGQLSGGDKEGGYFVRGLDDGLNKAGATAGSAFRNAQQFVIDMLHNEKSQRPLADPNVFSPSGVFLPAGSGKGDAMKIGTASGASSLHAILWFGSPEECGDWNDIYWTWQTLKDQGFADKDIKVFFGSGERGADGSPEVWPTKKLDRAGPNRTIKPPISVRSLAQLSHCAYQGENAANGTLLKYEAATFANVQKALEAWKGISEKSSNEQFVLVAHGHNWPRVQSGQISFLMPGEGGARPGFGYPTLPGMPSQDGTYVAMSTGFFFGQWQGPRPVYMGIEDAALVQRFGIEDLETDDSFAGFDGHVTVGLSETSALHLGVNTYDVSFSGTRDSFDPLGQDLLFPGVTSAGFSLIGLVPEGTPGGVNVVDGMRYNFNAENTTFYGAYALARDYGPVNLTGYGGVAHTISNQEQRLAGDIPGYGFGFAYNTTFDTEVTRALAGATVVYPVQSVAGLSVNAGATLFANFADTNGQDSLVLDGVFESRAIGNNEVTFAWSAGVGVELNLGGAATFFAGYRYVDDDVTPVAVREDAGPSHADFERSQAHIGMLGVRVAL